MCVPTFDASDRQRGGQRTARRVDYTARCAPHDGVDDIPRHNSSQPCTVDTWRRAFLEKRVRNPSDLRTAEGRRRTGDLKLLVSSTYYRPHHHTHK